MPLALVLLSLPRRADRHFVFERTFPGLRGLPVEVFPAVDAEYVPEWKVARMREKWNLPRLNAKNYAVRLSKRLALRAFLQSDAEAMLFMEDDCLMLEGWAEDCERLLAEMPPSWDMAFLGGQVPSAEPGGLAHQPAMRLSAPTADNHCVLFSKKGARLALRLLRTPRDAFSDQDLSLGIAEGTLEAYWTGRYTAVQRALSSDNYGTRSGYLPAGNMMAGPDDVWVLAASVKPGDTVLEWGSGGSTQVLAERVGTTGKVHSCEHQPAIYQQTLCQLEHAGLQGRVQMHHVPARPQRPQDNQWRMMPSQMTAYVQAPRLSLDAAKVDVAYLDGPSRTQCADVALDLLRPGGLLLIHDFCGRARYREHTEKILLRARHVCSTPLKQGTPITDLVVFCKL